MYSAILRLIHVIVETVGNSSTYSDCVSVALVIRHAKRMRHTVLSHVACHTLLYFSTLSHKRHDFRIIIIEHKTCVLNFYIHSV
jgi:hypothetical protein